MPTARELLEQADALMRRNRGRADPDIPVLTEVVGDESVVNDGSDEDIPVLTQTVDETVVEVDDSPLVPAVTAADQGEPSAWFGPDSVDPSLHSVTGPAPDTVAVVPSDSLSGDDDERWRALAEQISMQVLQRIDLFTDTGLKEQLAQHLQPIVERASAQLVEAINEHVGQLLRSYVAQAIEREIAQWRQQQP